MATVRIDPEFTGGRPIPGGPTSTKNDTLERESRGWTALVVYSGVFISLDLWKQVTSYGIKYYNNDQYAVPQTLIVGSTEIFKLFLSVLLLLYQGTLGKVSFTWLFAVPAVIYAVNNNIYFYALHYTTPPVWNILIQQRIIFTGLVYRFWFKRSVTSIQWVALIILIGAIVLTNVSEGKTSSRTGNLSFAILLATGGSALSTIGTVYTEYLMKNNQRSFAEMQLQLYTYGCVGCAFLYLVQVGSAVSAQETQWDNPMLIIFLLVACILLSGTAGLSTAIIVKKLDNIVKLYTQALSNMLTSVACAVFFPNKFSISPLFLICIILVFIAIFLYERKTVDLSQVNRLLMTQFSSPVKAVVPFLLFGIMLALAFWQFAYRDGGDVIHLQAGTSLGRTVLRNYSVLTS